ncbi:MAG: CAP family protein [Proteobacteria bacterium]|nr:CAP family protein [Pseudomonadota bacterium]
MLAALAALGFASQAHAQDYPYYYPPGYYPAYPPGYPYPAPSYPAYPPGYPAYPQGTPDNGQSYPAYPPGYPAYPQGAPDSAPDSAQSYPGNPPASAESPDEDSGSIAELLAAHNQYRSALGLPPLHWSTTLAERAQRWAEHLASIGQLVHSGSGQNLAMAAAGTQSLTQLVQLWGNEEANFTDGAFPNISRTGNWMDVGHYSQLIWRSTSKVGCGFAEDNGNDVLVCDYSPPGNVMGERPY